ncbi:hypothetical protein DFJ73DRAFT_964305 [Zopfochytrium polystomum]|nr:hypothetical protein DFJ73DRAFT_964305 [Zopfochytrium polystomum]
MIERPTKARYVLDSYCDYERYIYQFVVYEILWDVLFFFVGLFFLVHAIIAYYRKHRDLSGSSLSSSSAPSSAQEGPALPKSTIMQFILRMIVWCFGISVFSLVYFAASIFTAWTKYGDGGWYNTVGVQTDAASMSIFTPSVCSILMFACFGSTQRARLAYATLFGCCCVRNRKYPVSSDGGALTRQESGVALNTLPPPTNSNPQNPYALNSPVAILYPSTAPGGDVGPITTRFNSGDDDDFMLPRSPRSPTSPWATAPDRPPLGPGARVSPYPATSAAAAGIGRDGWSTSLDRERTSMGLVRKGSEKRDHVGRDPVVLQDVSAFTPGWKSPPTSYAVQPAPAAASAAYHPHGYSQPLPNAHSHIVAPPGGDRSKPIPF